MPADTRSIFAQRLQSARNSRGLTQQELAEILDVDVKTVRNWEIQGGFPRPNILDRLSEEFEYPVAWFFLSDNERIETGEKTVTPREALAVLAEMVDGAPEKSADEKFYIAHVDTSHYSRRRAKSREPKTERKEKS